MPTVSVLDFEAPLPSDHTHVRSREGAEMGLGVIEPLRTFRVTLHGRGQVHDDPSALLRNEPGEPTDVQVDLTWSTGGRPYQYQMSPRYEIPCQVSGTVTAAGRAFELTAVAGQRDHSWAPRDWWSMDWVWSALHLDDDTHIHGVEISIPGIPPISVGYLQNPGEPLVELDKVSTRSSFAGNGLPLTSELSFSPGDLVVTIDLQGHAPVLLASPDGRLSRFPRSWGTVTAADGRTGTGWIEWNRSQS